MQSRLLQQNQDPFIVLKNQRNIFLRPKAKYVRKVPVPPRKIRKDFKPENLEIKQFKNERKMTADSDIENDLISSNIGPQIPNESDSKEFPYLISQETGTTSNLLEELQILDRVLPLDFRSKEMEQEIPLTNQDNELIDFFSD